MRVVLFSRVPAWYSFRGDQLVTRLAQAGHDVAGIVVERMPTVASLRTWVDKLGPGVCLATAILRLQRCFFSEAVSASGIVSPPVHVVDSHNSAVCVELVRSLRPDVLILRGCGIIKWPILEIPKLGTLNPHYAVLPTYRGVDVTEWAALHGDPVAVSVHFVAEGVDTGAVLASRRLTIEPGETLGRLRKKSAAVAVDLFIEVLETLAAGTAVPTPQPMTEGKQYFSMHPRLRHLANERLRSAS